ncbi:unnamed protein product [Urochloa humidicola]
MGSTADDSSSAVSPAAQGQGNAAGVVTRDGVAFTVTERNEVAAAVGGSAARAGQRQPLRRGHRDAAPLHGRGEGGTSSCCSSSLLTRTSAASS